MVLPGEHSPGSDEDVQWMLLALHEATIAAEKGEVPVGAAVVKDGKLLSLGRNSPISSSDPCAHAEIVALRAAAQVLGNYRLDGCDLYSTLEPCTMCAGAILHSRIRRLVYGAADPKAGAAGSTLDVFGYQKLNHQTSVIGGVLAEQCAETLQAFFQDRRSSQRLTSDTLRVDALRTPDSKFNDLPGYPWPARYVKDLPALAGLRMHFLDEGPVDAETTFLCLHGNPGWSYLYRKMLPIWVQANCRVIAPDLIGFGKSDKPKRSDFHSFTFHRQCLLELVDHLDLKGIVLVVQDWGGILGLTIPMDQPDRFKGVLVMNTLLATGDMPLTPGFLAWREMCAKHPEFDVGRLFMRANPHMTSSEAQAYNAPFPDAGHRAALRAFPNMVPEKLDSPGADLSRRARNFWSDTWTGKSLMVIGAMDPVLGSPTMHELHQHIRNCPKPIELAQAGHFVQEHGEPIAKMALNQFKHG